MAKIEIPIRVYMGEIEEIINELKHLQTYKLFEEDDKVLINRDDVIKIFVNHLRTETLSGSTIEPEQETGKWYIDAEGDVRCTACKTKCLRDDIGINILSNYCPSCGVKMKEENSI